MTSFSQRYGYKPIKSIIQIETLDHELRVSLWNALDSSYWNKVDPQYYMDGESNGRVLRLVEHIWSEYFKLPTDTISRDWKPIYKHLRDYYFFCSWNEVYDFIEFVADHYSSNYVNDSFRKECNVVLKREISGYRFIGDTVTQITAEEEVAEIEEALKSKQISEPVIIHLESALDLFSDRKSPDYRNSIKESISAVEAMCNLITGKEKATLGDALKRITGKIELHPALQESFSHLYGYTSDADGIRHALLDEGSLDSEDVKFMLVSCSALLTTLK